MTNLRPIWAATVFFCLAGVPATKVFAQPESLPWLPAINFLLLAEEVIQLPPPANQFNIGDSIGVGEAADDTIFSDNPESVWSTGYAQNDGVQSLNERSKRVIRQLIMRTTPHVTTSSTRRSAAR